MMGWGRGSDDGMGKGKRSVDGDEEDGEAM